MNTIRTDAWILRGISSIPGDLVLSDDAITFTATGTGSAWPWQLRKLGREMGAPKLARIIDSGQRTVVFRWPVQELKFWVPWYYFGGGMKIQHSGHVLKLSFGRPFDRVGSRNDPAEDLRQAAANLKEVGVMRNNGALWVSALSAAAASARDA